MTDTSARSRQPAGVRTGGQFATEPRGEADVSLGATAVGEWAASPEDPDVAWFEESGLLAQVVTLTSEVDRSADYDRPHRFHRFEWDVTDGDDTVLASGTASSERQARKRASGALRAAAARLSGGPFRFDHEYDNVEQVRPYFEAYSRRRAELAAAGRYPYNDDFKGHVPGIEGPDEDSAIYLLQHMHDRDEIAAKVTQFAASGGREVTVTDLTPGQVLRGQVVHYGFYSGGTGWQRFESARLLVDHGRLVVLEKGKRTNGHWLQGMVLCRED